MIELYTFDTSNGRRATLVLEECGLPYRVHRVDLSKGEQNTPEFLAINPAGAIPVIVDPDGPGGKPLTLTQSGAIAVYAADKAGRFLAREASRRVLALQWLMFAVSDVAPASTLMFYESTLLPEKSEANAAFAQQRLLRLLRVADSRLAGRDWLADELSVADFGLYPVCALRRGVIDGAGNLPNLTRWMAALAKRPAVAKVFA